MANEKDLALLTIGGVTFRNVFTDKNIGKSTRASSDTGTLPGQTNTYIGNPITIPETGLYYCYAIVELQGSVTGDVIRYIAIAVNGVTDYAFPQIVQNHSKSIHRWSLVRRFNKDDVVRIWMWSYAQASVSNAVLEAIKMADYPGLGGVTRTLKSLKNSICYRPLNFGKAVA